MAIYLLLAAIVMIICIILNKLTDRLGIPMLLAFILLGMFFGSDGIVKIPFENYRFAEQICSIALIFIMFYGGFGTSWKAARPVAAQSILLSTLGVAFTAGLTGLFCHYALNFSWLESLLTGAVMGSTDAASVFSILRAKRLNLRYNTASMLEMESGSNDPFAYMLTILVLSLMNHSAEIQDLAYMLFAQVVYGVFFGCVLAAMVVWVMRKVAFDTDGFDTVFVFSAAILAYALPSIFGGNGYLSVYLFGMILGNVELPNKKSLVHFFDGITSLMQMLVFFLLGLLSFPSRLPYIVLPALCIALFLTFVARPLAVSIILAPFRCPARQLSVVSWAGLRGAASIVFAIMAIMQVDTSNDLFHIVFCIVLFSILVQGTLLPVVSRRLGMLDADGDVLKTFNDYSEENPIEFISSRITAAHPWCGKEIRELEPAPDTLIALLIRNQEKIIPNGSTVLQDGDKLIICARSHVGADGIHLYEVKLTEESPWINRTLAECSVKKHQLIIMIQREDKVLIPSGNTLLKKNDVLVINQTHHP